MKKERKKPLISGTITLEQIPALDRVKEPLFIYIPTSTRKDFIRRLIQLGYQAIWPHLVIPTYELCRSIRYFYAYNPIYYTPKLGDILSYSPAGVGWDNNLWDGNKSTAFRRLVVSRYHKDTPKIPKRLRILFTSIDISE